MIIMEDSIANIREAIPDIKYNVVEGGGHLVHYENPESVNRLLKDFFLEK